MSYNIGEFSQVTGLSVKTLRFYHENGILIPCSVDEATGYRFYDVSKVEKARVIMRLRQMEFSIEDNRSSSATSGKAGGLTEVERLEAAEPFGRQPTRSSQSPASDLVSLAPQGTSGERAGERGPFNDF